MIGDLGRDVGNVHPTLSDGKNTIEENVTMAHRRGLHTICLVDHVRADSDWLPEFIQATDELIESDAEHREPLTILRGVETKVLDQAGASSTFPPTLEALDHILVADHQFYMEELDRTTLLRSSARHRGRQMGLPTHWRRCSSRPSALLLEAVAGIGILAHMFSVLPKVQGCEGRTCLPPVSIGWQTQSRSGSEIMVEVNERRGRPLGVDPRALRPPPGTDRVRHRQSPHRDHRPVRPGSRDTGIDVMSGGRPRRP